jgi:hypothetical protein
LGLKGGGVVLDLEGVPPGDALLSGLLRRVFLLVVVGAGLGVVLVVEGLCSIGGRLNLKSGLLLLLEDSVVVEGGWVCPSSSTSEVYNSDSSVAALPPISLLFTSSTVLVAVANSLPPVEAVGLILNLELEALLLESTLNLPGAEVL